MITESSWLKIRRYEESGLFKATHYTTQAQALEDAGYATKEKMKMESLYMRIYLIDLNQKNTIYNY